jgi:energy-coupling factor transporter ATP-binding protein EcfA2
VKGRQAPRNRAVYVIGAPGSGKTTLVRAVMEAEGAAGIVQHEKPVPHVEHVGTRWVELGRWRPEFGGTDALSYSIAPKATAWLIGNDRPRWLIAEGDRLATASFFDVLTGCYPRFTLFHLAGDDAALRQGASRAELIGKAQNEAWWRGRATKCGRLAVAYQAIELEAGAPLADLVAQVGEIIRR